MAPTILLGIVLAYFFLLFTVSRLTGTQSDNSTFFLGNRKSAWYVVAFGMIGASLSGVTFLSIPGDVVNNKFYYMQIVFGYLLGYVVIAFLLLPLYYKLQLTTIYTYLKQRLGEHAYKTGATFFLISRLLGSALRLYLAALILHNFILSSFQIPFEASVAIAILFIWIYSFRGGIKTIVWTDTLQTLFMILAVVISIVFILNKLEITILQSISLIQNSDYGEIFNWDYKSNTFFWKNLISGMFITIAMTGLDQDMMQKNLSCKNLRDAQKNVLSMSLLLLPVNLLFLGLGALLYIYAHSIGVIIDLSNDCALNLMLPDGTVGCYKTDSFFAFLTVNYLPAAASVVFILGLTAAAYSSADSALTALTTSFCIDFLGMNEYDTKVTTRYKVHIMFSTLTFLIIVIFKHLNNQAVINEIFKIAGYTYGPLLGLFSFGLFTKRRVIDRAVPAICIIAPIFTYIVGVQSPVWFNGYKFGFELLIINGLITFFLLYLASKRPTSKTSS